MRKAFWVVRFNSRIKLKTISPLLLSRFPVGSSARTKTGSLAIVGEIATGAALLPARKLARSVSDAFFQADQSEKFGHTVSVGLFKKMPRKRQGIRTFSRTLYSGRR